MELFQHTDAVIVGHLLTLSELLHHRLHLREVLWILHEKVLNLLSVGEVLRFDCKAQADEACQEK